MMRTIAIALLVLAACGKSGDKNNPSSNAGPSGGGAKDAVLDAWKKGGLEASAFTAATTNVGKDCVAGTVNKVDVLICSFGSADEAKKAEDLGLAWVGDTTGSSRAKGSLVIAASDRRKSDPSGRTINQLFKLVPQ